MKLCKGVLGMIPLLLASLASPAPADDSKARVKDSAPPENAIVHVHDPEGVKEGRYYYVFSTGPGVMIRRSRDLKHWTYVGRVFEGTPEWAMKAVPGADKEFIWAPGLARFNGLWHLYYSVSTFGGNRSVIGLATSKTLDPDSKDYGWTDRGLVVESQKGGDHNAIDAAVVLAGRDKASLTYGSWWSGIKMVDLDVKTGKPAPGAALKSLEERPNWAGTEAPFITKMGDYYYLLTSWDSCCRGVNSTYNIRMGRSKDYAGPYVGRDGTPLMKGGATPLLGTEGRWIGPGHCSVLTDGSRRYLVFHAYDRDNNGVPTLRIRPLTLDKEGWPVLGPAVFEPEPPAPAEPSK